MKEIFELKQENGKPVVISLEDKVVVHESVAEHVARACTSSDADDGGNRTGRVVYLDEGEYRGMKAYAQFVEKVRELGEIGGF